MPPAVTYWTGTWDPEKEAISKEVNALRESARARAPVVAFSPANRNRLLLRDRVVTLSPRSWLALRAVAAVVEPQGDITHIFGGMSSWHLFRALGRRPILLTAVDSRYRVDGLRLPNARIVRIAVESEADREEWLTTGMPPEHIEVIYPGIEVDWYQPAPLVTERPTWLFASTPADPAEFETRGVVLLVELARHRPDIDILVPWRNWGDVGEARRALDALRPPGNFLVEFGDAVDMRSYYARAHGTIACFAEGAGKTCPNFVLEGLASGRPCITTPSAGVAPLLERAGAGVVASRDVRSLSAAVDQLRAGWAGYAGHARRLAEAQFDVRNFRARYEKLYGDIAMEASALGRRDAVARSTAG